MTPGAASDAVTAAQRFGFAARPGDLDIIGRDPRAWVLHQLAEPPTPLPGELPNGASMVAATLQARREQKEQGANGNRKDYNQQMRSVYLAEIDARVRAAAQSERPLLERLTQFWSNHFTVSAFRPVVHGVAGAFEREAIRPHVVGHFSDMLLAAVRHPGMLLYLDNAQSVGPDSIAGQRRDKGINENLGRELLELHTLGVDGGYSQADVEAMARILTGWSVARLVDPSPGSFHFYPRIHEPGPKLLLGRSYREDGEQEGVTALMDLAHHPATARHIARKLTTHFIADNPPKETVDRIARVFHDTGGDLRQVTAAIIREEAAWHAPFGKLKTPNEMVIAAARVATFAPPPGPLAASMKLLDQPTYFAPSPAGWPDVAAAWASPEAILHRVDWCQAFANGIPEPPDPVALAEATLGETLPADTLTAIRRAPSRRVGLALLFASPQFQRR